MEKDGILTLDEPVLQPTKRSLELLQQWKLMKTTRKLQLYQLEN